MGRPTIDAIDFTKAGWVADLNDAFVKIFEAPFPIYLAADKATLDAIAPALYVNCHAIVATDSRIYISNGTIWSLYDSILDNIADMNPGVSTITDIKNAYNALLADMKTKGMMATS